MPYAVFEDDQKLSRAFPTEQETLRKADEAGLVVEESNGKPVLDSDLAIKPCSSDPEVGSDDELDWPVEKPAPVRKEDDAGNEGRRDEFTSHSVNHSARSLGNPSASGCR
jgi:hypothetical protein